MKRNIFIFLAFATAQFSNLKAQYQEVNAQIKELTIYTSAAEIYYEKEVHLKKGKNTLVFTDLTPFIENNTVNVSVNDASVNILTVTEKINFSKEKRTVSERLADIQDSVKRMKKELGLIKCKTDVLSAEKNLLFKGESIGGLSTQGVSVAEIEKASAFFSRRYYDLLKELFTLGEREDELNERIRRFQNQEKESVTVSVKTTSEILVSINSPSEKKVKFNFRFLTTKGGWAPMYDFKYEGPTNPLQFVFRANVFNATGIDWNEVGIKLSTADPISGFNLPSLNNKSASPYNSKKSEGNIQYKQLQVANAITEYKITHQYSIPSDSKPYLVEVDAYAMPASFNYLLIPGMDPFGFLMAKIPGWNKYNLLPGTTNVYNHGSYMGKTFLNTYTENDTLSMYLGKDQNIQCTRSEKSIINKHFLIGNFITEENKIDIVVRNNSADALPVEIMDQVPIILKTDNEKMNVSGIENALYNKNEGLLTWKLTLKPGESQSLHFEYEIKSPKESQDEWGGYKPKKKRFRTVSCPAF